MKEKMSRTFHKHKFEMKLQQSYQFEFKKNDAWKIYNTKSKQFRTFEKITKRIFLWKIYQFAFSFLVSCLTKKGIKVETTTNFAINK